jgi:hypothetical protein
MRFSEYTAFCVPEPARLAINIFVILLVCSVISPLPATASEAPLDTLKVETIPDQATDPRYTGADIPISRKLLPEAQATTVPQTTTPRRPPRLDDPMAARWHEHMASEANKAGDSKAQVENQVLASQADPNNPRFDWPVVFSALAKMDFPTLLQKLPRAVARQLGNPIYRGHFVIGLQHGSLLFVGIFWSALVVALTLTWWRYLAHDISAFLWRGTNHRAALWSPLLLPVIFLLFRPGWFGFLALMSIPLLIQARGSSRRILASTWIIAIIIAFPMWPIIKDAVPVIDPTSEANLLVNATTHNSTPVLRNDLRKRLEGAIDPERKNRLEVALGIQEARRGRYKTSSKLFKSVLAGDPNNLPAMVGLANNMYYIGRLDTAADLFHEASLAHVGNGLILHNQAQVFFKKLFIPEAAEALEKSRALGYNPPLGQGQKSSSKTYSPVVYPGLTNRALQEACAWESGNYAVGITLMAWEAFLGSPPIPLFLFLSIALLLAGALILLWSHQHDPRECENCGVTVCGECCVVRQDSWLCNECGGIVDRARSDMILATLLKNRSRSQGMATASTLVHLCRSFPGAGPLAIGQTFGAWIRLTMLSWGIFLMFAAWALTSLEKWLKPGLILPQETVHPMWAPLPVALWEGWSAPLVLIGAGLIVASWLVALIDGAQIRHQIPERFSLSLSSTRTKQETTETQSVSVS